MTIAQRFNAEAKRHANAPSQRDGMTIAQRFNAEAKRHANAPSQRDGMTIAQRFNAGDRTSEQPHNPSPARTAEVRPFSRPYRTGAQLAVAGLTSPRCNAGLFSRGPFGTTPDREHNSHLPALQRWAIFTRSLWDATRQGDHNAERGNHANTRRVAVSPPPRPPANHDIFGPTMLLDELLECRAVRRGKVAAPSELGPRSALTPIR